MLLDPLHQQSTRTPTVGIIIPPPWTSPITAIITVVFISPKVMEAAWLNRILHFPLEKGLLGYGQFISESYLTPPSFPCPANLHPILLPSSSLQLPTALLEGHNVQRATMTPQHLPFSLLKTPSSWLWNVLSSILLPSSPPRISSLWGSPGCCPLPLSVFNLPQHLTLRSPIQSTQPCCTTNKVIEVGDPTVSSGSISQHSKPSRTLKFLQWLFVHNGCETRPFSDTRPSKVTCAHSTNTAQDPFTRQEVWPAPWDPSGRKTRASPDLLLREATHHT